ncbi:response regulator [Mangrovimicrobium sediminis]|uniref:histidine kinase n=1 Tax=Mangrovimicrobium sediminis TaxID=2562682 RepID=A0A4Z0M1Q9_9GAMM|nr:ATP-binding protein [Haliea sp. SAOS-164]TGD73542.1 response regulator [Haliea sp. SAOS-164]
MTKLISGLHWKTFFGYAVVCLTIFLMLSAFLYDQQYKLLKANRLQREGSTLEQKMRSLQTRLDADRKSIDFLFDVPPISGIVRATQGSGYDAFDETGLAQWKSRLEQIFAAYLTTNHDVRQVRYIGVADNGRELVRVQWEGGKPVAVGAPRLQQKSDRPYFQEMLNLEPGAYYISDIELNREHGVIDFPQWATYRIGKGVFDAKGELFGLLILNIDADSVISLLEYSSEGAYTYLLNDDRQFLRHPRPGVAFSFDLGTPVRWEDEFSREIPSESASWTQVTDKLGEQFHAFAHTVQYSGGIHPKYVTAIKTVNDAGIVAEAQRETAKLAAILGVILFVLTGIIFLLRQANLALGSTSALQARFRSALQNAPLAILVLDQQRRVEYRNESAQQLMPDFGEQSFNMSSIKSAEARTWLTRAFDEVLETGEVLSRELWLDNGTTLDGFYQVLIGPIWENDARPSGAILMAMDMTQQKYYEQELQELNKSLEARIRSRTNALEDALTRAEAATQAQGEFLATMSHEIRTPLNAVFGMLALVRRGHIDGKQASQLDMAESNLTALSTLLNDILDVSKIEEGELQIDPVEYEPERLLQACGVSHSAVARSKGIDLVLDLAEIDGYVVLGDQNRIRQIVNNLLNNAIKFTQAGGVTLRAELRPGQNREEGDADLVITVEDSGIGIENSKLDMIFSRFAQAEASTTRRFGGVGLGLSICRQLCELMHGEITVESEAGKGTAFRVRLPQRMLAPRAAADSAPDMDEEAVLVMTQSPALAGVVSRTLTRWGARCEQLPEAEALAALAAPDHPLHYSLVVMDEACWTANHECLALYLARENGCDAGRILLLERFVDGTQLEADQLHERVQRVEAPVSSRELDLALRSLDPQRYGAVELRMADYCESQGLHIPGASLLMVDDHHANLEVLSGLLEDSGATLHRACNGVEALSVLQSAPESRPIDLVLMDCHMPVMDGYEATEAIRAGAAGARYLEVPILALTAAALKGEREHCLDMGMDDYLSKPFQVSELENLLRHWLADYVVEPESEPAPGSVQPNPETPADAVVMPAGTAETADPPADLESAWDCAGALCRLGGRSHVLDKVLAAYRQAAPDMWTQIHSYMADGSPGKVARAAHGLKGVALNVGAVRVAALARVLELSAESMPDAELLGTVEELHAAIIEFDSISRSGVSV